MGRLIVFQNKFEKFTIISKNHNRMSENKNLVLNIILNLLSWVYHIEYYLKSSWYPTFINSKKFKSFTSSDWIVSCLLK